MNLTPLVRTWWMMAIRGVLAMAFGVSLVIWPGLTLSIVVLLFGIYATIDGAWSIAAGMRASTCSGDVWPALLEGGSASRLASLPWLGLSCRAAFLYMITAWGVITGVLQVFGIVILFATSLFARDVLKARRPADRYASPSR